MDTGVGSIFMEEAETMIKTTTTPTKMSKDLLKMRSTHSHPPLRALSRTLRWCGCRRLADWVYVETLGILACWTVISCMLAWTLWDGLMEYFEIPHLESHAAPTDSKEIHSVEIRSLKFFLLCALGGSLSCGLTHTAIVPLDLIKCRIQVNPSKYQRIRKGIEVTMAEEGSEALAKGWAPTLIGYSLQGLGKFGFYELFKLMYADLLGPELTYLWRTSLFLVAAASAEFFADMMLAPMEAAKGLPALWLRQIPYTMMKFACFERTVELLYLFIVPKAREDCSKPEQLIVTFIAGYIAGIFCAIVSHPADSVISKLNQTPGSSAVKIFRELGPNGVWRGLFARILMIGTLTALQWYIYDSVKVAFNLPRPPPPIMPESLRKQLISP